MEFRFEVEHLPGRLNPADTLTRCEPFEPVPPGPLPQPMEGVASSDAAAVAAVTDRPEPAGAAKTTDPARFTPAYTRAFTTLAGARLHLVTGVITVQPNPSQPSRQTLAPDFVAALQREMHIDHFFGPVFNGAAATVGGMVDRKEQPMAPPQARS